MTEFKEGKLLNELHELRKDDDFSLASFAARIVEIGQEQEILARKTCDAMCDYKGATDATKAHYKREVERSERISAVARILAAEIMTVQKELWRPVNEKIAELYRFRTERGDFNKDPKDM
jgi:hypothetical protein